MQSQSEFRASTKVSPEFKAKARKAIYSVIGFALTFITVVVLTIALSALCILGAVALVALGRFNWIVLVFAFGLLSLGVIISIFVLKFLFKWKKDDRSDLIEVQQQDEPRLFSFIESIVSEVGTHFPKKVFLSHEVNACVFYDSDFWSMFFPVRKNLVIGMGLINSMTEAELKAILAHEFGHFSQKSMRVGSYVYNANRVLQNMLFDNESFERLVVRWAGFNRYIAFFVRTAVRFTVAVKWIMGKMYERVNRNHLALAREMEFHADMVAAHVAGSESMCSALLRLQYAESSFNTVMEFYNSRIAEKLKSENLYREQHFVMNFNAGMQKIPVLNNFPAISLKEHFRINNSKLTVQNPWASHPEIRDRVERVLNLRIEGRNLVNDPALKMFSDADGLQKRLSGQLLEEGNDGSAYTDLPYLEFESSYRDQINANRFPDCYNGYYDFRAPLLTDFVASNHTPAAGTLEALFSDQAESLAHNFILLENDIATLDQIAGGKMEIQFFDYDGHSYQAGQGADLRMKLEQEHTAIKEQLVQNDKDIFCYFLSLENQYGAAGRLQQLYEELSGFDKEFDAFAGIQRELRGKLEFVNESHTHAAIEEKFRLLEPLEMKFKESILSLIRDERFQTALTAELREGANAYASATWVYFDFDQYNDQNLSKLFEALGISVFMFSRSFLHLKRQVLEYQVSLLPAAGF